MKRIHLSHIFLHLLSIAIVATNLIAAERKPLFLDMQFQHGFLLSYPSSAQGRAVAAVLDFDDPNNKPHWRLCQWGTQHSLATVACRRGGADAWYENDAKKVLVGGAARAGLICSWNRTPPTCTGSIDCRESLSKSASACCTVALT